MTPDSFQVELPRGDFNVRRGDFIIANRLNPVQAVMNLSKDPWTHAAIAGMRSGQLGAIELGPKGCGFRRFDAFRPAYRIVGIARPRMHACCIDAAASKAETHLERDDIAYSWDTCTVLESVALMRCFAPARHEAIVVRSAERRTRRLLRRSDPAAMTCAGFVDSCFASACDECRPKPIWPRRPRAAPWRGLPSVTDLRYRPSSDYLTDPALVRALSTPADLWLAECWEFKVIHRDDRTTVLIDAADYSTERRSA